MKNINTLLILAGGKGTRFKEYTNEIPKPMIEACGTPLLIHIVNIYKKFGITNVVILAGYKGKVIIDYFEERYEKIGVDHIYKYDEQINVKILDTGEDSMTGWRIKKGIEDSAEENFYMTYGDGLGNVEIDKLTELHFKNNTMASLTAVRPPARFGSIELNNSKVTRFGEKQNTDEGWINGGFFILNKKVANLIKDETTVFEKAPLETLSKNGDLSAYLHDGFWQPCDTIRELELLESAIKDGKLMN
jgi:glucose-1-phosphate cytidylyltransferase